jgi:hypothetical protein
MSSLATTVGQLRRWTRRGQRSALPLPMSGLNFLYAFKLFE